MPARQPPPLWPYCLAAAALALGTAAVATQLAMVDDVAWDELGVSLRFGSDLHVADTQLPLLRNVSARLDVQHAYGATMRLAWRRMLAGRITQTLPVKSPSGGSCESRAAGLAIQLTTSSPAVVNRLLEAWRQMIRPRSVANAAVLDVRTMLKMRAPELEQRLLATATPSDALASAVSTASAAATGELPEARSLAEALRPLLADMFCPGCAETNAHAQRRAVSGAVLMAPAENLAALANDFSRWALARWADASYSAAVTLTPDDEFSEPGPSTFTVRKIKVDDA